MGKQIHQLTLTREDPKKPFGFRIIGGKDEGQTFKVEKVLTGYPSYYAGLKVHDFLISVNGQEVFEMNHAQCCALIKNAGGSLNLSVERGDHIVPNFEEIWPSGKTKETKKGKFDMDYLTDAMNKGIPGERNKDFTTCGKPKVTVNQYDNPIDCYSEETIEDMTNSAGGWMKTEDQAAQTVPDLARFNPNKSEVLSVIVDNEKKPQMQVR